MSSEPHVEDLTIEQIREIFLAGGFSRRVHTEVRDILAFKEQQYVAEEIQNLTNINLNEFQGSPHGFYYDGELFSVGAAFQRKDITVIDESLNSQAESLKANRIDISQFMTYLAHFLAYLDDKCSEAVGYVANMPSGLSRFSPSLYKLENWVRSEEPSRIENARLSLSDSENTIFFLHFNRVEEPLQRFLFRRITK